MVLGINDLLITPLYFLVIITAARVIQKKNIQEKPYYKYYVSGLLVKILGTFALSFVYIFYYKGGDTTNFYEYGSSVMFKLFMRSPADFFSVLFGERNSEHWALFDDTTGWPYYYRDENSFFVSRFISPLTLIAFNSYLGTALLLATLCYTGVWRLYEVFVEKFPEINKQLAIAVLFMPSVVFWGSGILKDSITLAAVGWFTYAFYKILIKKQFRIIYILGLFVAVYLLFSIKPYILYALLPGSLLWLNSEYLSSIKGRFLRVMITPVLLLMLSGVSYLLVMQLGSNAGKYSVDTLLERAVITQRDLRMDYYGGNAFDIGDFDPTLKGVLSKAPIAIISGLFRPFIWEVKNPFMLLSALENFFLIYMTLKIFMNNPKTLIVSISKNPLVLFSIMFALFFAFSVGLTTPNFGSLVRYRIPEIPFWLGSLYVLNYCKENELVNI